MSDPRFSVVIAVYNGIPFIQKALDSVLKQKVPAHQIIVVDDGSTDETPNVLAGYGDKIQVVRKANGGVSKARNTALPLVTGDYIAFLDADDVWIDNKLECHAEAIRRYPDIGVFFCNYVVRVDIFGNRLTNHYEGLQTRSLLNFDEPLKANALGLLVRENFTGTPSAAVVKKSVIDRIGFFSDAHRPSEDYEYWLRCAVVTNFVLLSEVQMYKRTHDRNLSADKIRNGLSHRKVLLDLLDIQRKYIRAHGLEGICRSAVARIDYYLGDLSYAAGRAREAFGYFREGLAADPSFRNVLEYAWIVSKKSVRFLLESVSLLPRRPVLYARRP